MISSSIKKLQFRPGASLDAHCRIGAFCTSPKVSCKKLKYFFKNLCMAYYSYPLTISLFKYFQRLLQMNTVNLAKINDKINKKMIKQKQVLEERKDIRDKINKLHPISAADEAAYQASVAAFNIAKARMEAAEQKKLQSSEMISNYRVEVEFMDYDLDKISCDMYDLQLHKETVELKQKINASRKKEKKVDKKHKNNEDSEKLVTKIKLMPVEVMRLIIGYLSYDARVSIIKDRFTSVMDKCKGLKPSPLFIAFLDYASTSPEFLPLLNRTEARQQINSLTPPPVNSWDYEYQGKYTYYKYSYKTRKSSTELIKNRITWIAELAQARNPKFAYKIMKTVIVLGDLNRYKVSSTISPKRVLTIEDLPPSYR